MANQERWRISWQAHEHRHFDRTPNWFWAVGIVTAGIVAIALIVGNPLFAVVAMIGSVTLVFQALRKPDLYTFEITERGILVDDTLYPYASLDSFWIEPQELDKRIILKSKKMLVPYIIVPIEDVDPDEVRDFLLDYLPEEEHEEPFSVRFMEWLGF